MTWVRTDDGEVLDDRIGDLTDHEYRARHALLQYACREANETGLMHESKVNRAAFSTPKGVRVCTKTILQRLISLGLVERVENLTDEYLDSLGITRPDGPGWLRFAHWERFNPPRDKTNAERQARYRAALRNTESNAVTNSVTYRNDNGPSRVGAPAFPSRPVNEELLPSTEVHYEEEGRQENFYDEHRLDPADELARTIAAARAEAGLE